MGLSKSCLHIICIFDKMDERLTKKIVEEVFEKAKTKSASHSKHALSKQIELESRLSYKTLERTHNKFITKTRDLDYAPNSDSIDEFCIYLGYQDYADYVSKKSVKTTRPQDSTLDISKPTETVKPASKKKLQFLVIAALVIICMAIAAHMNYNSIDLNNTKSGACMTWNGGSYEEISCSEKPYSKFGTPIEPYEDTRLKNFKRVKVNMATPFFAEETDKPLIWYYKTNEGTIEYYTAPGVHPINGKTLKAVTKYIIQKYVPLHQNWESSFLIE